MGFIYFFPTINFLVFSDFSGQGLLLAFILSLVVPDFHFPSNSFFHFLHVAAFFWRWKPNQSASLSPGFTEDLERWQCQQHLAGDCSTDGFHHSLALGFWQHLPRSLSWLHTSTDTSSGLFLELVVQMLLEARGSNVPAWYLIKAAIYHRPTHCISQYELLRDKWHGIWL